MFICSQMEEHPEQFSAVGRAQLVTDFCYFYAHDKVYEYWFITGGFPALQLSNSPLSFELQQLNPSPWPLRLSSKQGLPPFLFAQSLTTSPKNSEVLLNLNFTSFYRVNYDPTTWISIFSQMDEHPEQFSAVGRAQLVTDFCYFYAHDKVDRGAAIKEIVVDVVYRNAEHFELCDWHLFWCHSTVPATLSQLLKRVALGVTRLFDNDAAFGCRTGQAARSLNSICNSVFGTNSKEVYGNTPLKLMAPPERAYL
ncbi:hypothetical protein ANCCEY_03629 [Ancylostoma ceylanicum]|uniref:Uncharacterized protein n=1 Tax=Ancylostoma ceylanicum TaxID=53326 RepID=A0A0D6M1A4_9BILA|nr:hypothetical protein ANCCEY_03629 [Ancylostoma ceylanicum]